MGNAHPGDYSRKKSRFRLSFRVTIHVRKNAVGINFYKERMSLVFINQGVKINRNIYFKEVLQYNLLPAAKQLYEYGNDYICFQQDGAPSHTV
jgi:hypothetical protein